MMAAQNVTNDQTIAGAGYKWTLGLAAAVVQSLLYFGIGHLRDIAR